MGSITLDSTHRFPADRLEQIRSAYPVLRTTCYLNTGTYGPMPEPAVAALLDAMGDLEREGVACRRPFATDAEEVRATLAALMGASPAELAFTRNATDGINLVLAGLSWSEGDEVITTDEEHEAVLHPLLYLRATRGIVLRRTSVSSCPDGMLRSLDALWSRRTRLVAVSHVSCETGTRLPVREIAGFARERGALSLIDAAQSLGAVPVDVAHIGCDFLSGNGHKWLHGPKGTGVLYAREDRMTELEPRHVGAGSLEEASFDQGVASLWSSGCRFEFGTRSYALMTGWKESLQWLGNLGMEQVWRHIAATAGQMKETLKKIAGVSVLTPAEANQASGLVSFTVRGFDAGQITRDLSENAAIVTRHVPNQNAVRVSAAHFTSERDIRQLEATVVRIVQH